jgi:hypothetical protein
MLLVSSCTLHKLPSLRTFFCFLWTREINELKRDLRRCLLIYYHIFLFQGPPVVSAASKRKKGEKNKGKGGSSIGDLLVIPFLSKFPVPSHGEDVSSKAVQK